MADQNMYDPNEAMTLEELLRIRDLKRQELAEAKRQLEEVRRENEDMDAEVGGAIEANALTRNQQAVEEANAYISSLNFCEQSKSCLKKLVDIKKNLLRLKEAEDAENRRMGSYAQEVKDMLDKFKNFDFVRSEAEAEKRVADLKKKVEERKQQLAQVVARKQVAMDRNESTRMSYIQKMTDLMKKKSDVKVQAMRLQMEQRLNAAKSKKNS